MMMILWHGSVLRFYVGVYNPVKNRHTDKQTNIQLAGVLIEVVTEQQHIFGPILPLRLINTF